MKKLVLIMIGILFFRFGICYAGQIIERYNFYSRYDPTSPSFVYDKTGNTATGDEIAVNTYTQKTIQITGVSVKEEIQVRIEGRLKDQVNIAEGSGATARNYAVLDVINFGVGSADTATNVAVDVTEYVDFLRVGIRNAGATGTSAIDVEGIFTNLER